MTPAGIVGVIGAVVGLLAGGLMFGAWGLEWWRRRRGRREGVSRAWLREHDDT